jgi:hypothetical protein
VVGPDGKVKPGAEGDRRAFESTDQFRRFNRHEEPGTKPPVSVSNHGIDKTTGQGSLPRNYLVPVIDSA